MNYYNLDFEYDDLENIIDSFVIEEQEEIKEHIIDEIVESLLSLIHEYVESNPSMLSCHNIDEIIIDEIYDLVDVMMENLKNDNYTSFLDYEEYIEELDLIEYSFDLYNSIFNITHDHVDNEIENSIGFQIDVVFDANTMEKKIDYLRSKPQPEQRTNDWYKFRHNLLTASNAHKALSTQSAINNLICEKCQPLKQIDPENPEIVKSVNINSPLHHGQKYEPLSVMLYEKKYNTKVEDFGCIKHDNYDFIGASPDGINVDKNSPLFGRMLEIKNVVSRVITGIPKKEYWIQMQLQMEVCDLDYCDFLETKFVEYENETDYKMDTESTKGVILYFTMVGSSTPYYLYQPLELNGEESEAWIESNIENADNNLTWIKTIYWKLDTYSCILVERNRSWFEHNIGQLENVWNTIVKERVEGHEHRLPQKRTKKIDPELNLELQMEMEMEQQNNSQKQTSIEGFCLLKNKIN